MITVKAFKSAVIVMVLSGCATLEDWNKKIPANDEPNECAVQVLSNWMMIKAYGGAGLSFDKCVDTSESPAQREPRKPTNE